MSWTENTVFYVQCDGPGDGPETQCPATFPITFDSHSISDEARLVMHDEGWTVQHAGLGLAYCPKHRETA